MKIIFVMLNSFQHPSKKYISALPRRDGSRNKFGMTGVGVKK
jgi:hypothetical protein